MLPGENSETVVLPSCSKLGPARTWLASVAIVGGLAAPSVANATIEDLTIFGSQDERRSVGCLAPSTGCLAAGRGFADPVGHFGLLTYWPPRLVPGRGFFLAAAASTMRAAAFAERCVAEVWPDPDRNGGRGIVKANEYRPFSGSKLAARCDNS